MRGHLWRFGKKRPPPLSTVANSPTSLAFTPIFPHLIQPSHLSPRLSLPPPPPDRCMCVLVLPPPRSLCILLPPPPRCLCLLLPPLSRAIRVGSSSAGQVLALLCSQAPLPFSTRFGGDGRWRGTGNDSDTFLRGTQGERCHWEVDRDGRLLAKLRHPALRG